VIQISLSFLLSELDLHFMIDTDEQYNEMFVRSFDDLGFFKKLASARKMLSTLFSRDAGDDGMDELERNATNIRHWPDVRGAEERSEDQRGRVSL
jgi:hypothetical protein